MKKMKEYTDQDSCYGFHPKYIYNTFNTTCIENQITTDQCNECKRPYKISIENKDGFHRTKR